MSAAEQPNPARQAARGACISCSAHLDLSCVLALIHQEGHHSHNAGHEACHQQGGELPLPLSGNVQVPLLNILLQTPLSASKAASDAACTALGSHKGTSLLS